MKRPLHYENIFWISLVHVLALCAIPYFSWPAFAISLAFLFTISPLGINLCYHRLLTHRSFKVPTWLEYVLSTIAATSAQGPMFIWVAEHRLHHRYSDQEGDPHNSREGFFHAHIGHLFRRKEIEDNPELWKKYVPDLTSHSYYWFLNRFFVLFIFAPAPLLYWWGGMSYVLWGIPVRIVMMWHVTWSVNSLCHGVGYRTFDTRDTSTNCALVGWIGAGEGWHNNHHAHPASAAHGRDWWEFDLTYQIIRGLSALGLATNVKTGVLDARLPKPTLEPELSPQ